MSTRDTPRDTPRVMSDEPSGRVTARITAPVGLLVALLGLAGGMGGTVGFYRVTSPGAPTDALERRVTLLEEGDRGLEGRTRQLELHASMSDEWRRSVDEKLSQIAGDVREIKNLSRRR